MIITMVAKRIGCGWSFVLPFKACVLMFLIPSQILAQGEPVWNLKVEHLQCIQSNVDKYAALDGEIIVIFPAACPETDLMKIMAQSTKNMSIAQVGKEEDSLARPAEVITFTREQLRCLRGIQVFGIEPVVQIPRDPC